MQKSTKVLSWLLSLVMVLSLVPSLGLTAYADATYSGGTGTEADPYLISSVDDWKALAAAVNSGTDYSGKYFKQTADLDMSNVSDIKPVGIYEAPFAGSYDGDGFKISNAAIQGVTVVIAPEAFGGSFKISMTVAGVFGFVAGDCSISNLNVEQLTVNAAEGTEGSMFMTFAGGLIALADSCTVTNCSVSKSSITTTGFQTYSGGVVGYASADGNSNMTSAFSKCASENNSINSSAAAGGFAGAIQNNNNGTITFTDCYSAKNTVTGQYLSAFLGSSDKGEATLTNGFVYDCTAGDKGVFINDTTNGKLNAVNCYYYDTHGLNPNAEGATAKTADEMKSLASALGDTFTDGELYPVFGHKHSFTYSANGATITATCDNADGKCSLTDCKVTLTIVPNPVLYYDDGQPKEASLEGLEAFNAATEKNISTDNIAYYKGDTNVTAQIKAGSGTSIKGAKYTARLDVEGKRATVEFSLSAKPIPHTHSFTYSVDGNVITATCNQNAANMDACDLTDKQATLTLNAPAHQTYGDGLDANAAFTGSIPGKDNPTINYRKSDTPLSSAPTDAGSYTAWCQLGNVTAMVNYTIAQATASYSTEPTAKTELVYTGEALELVNDGTVNGGDIVYTVGTDPDNEPDVYAGGRPYTSSVPEMTNAGTYYVWYKLEGGRNYTSIAANKIEVTIAKANITPSVSLEGWTYGEDAKTPSVDGNTGSGTVTYTYKVKDADDSTYSATVPTNAGDYTVKATIEESDNYNGGEATANFTISQKSASITADAKSKTYGDADPELTATVEDTVGSDTLNYTLNRAEGNNFGEYDITVTLGENPNYNITTTGAKLTIGKKALTVTAKNQSIYVGQKIPDWTAESYTVEGLVGEDTVEVSVEYWKDNAKVEELDKNKAGTYTIKPIVTAGDNYEVNAIEGKLTINYYPAPSTYAPAITQNENGTVALEPKAAEAGEKVTVKVTPDEGYKLDELTVKDASGKEIELTKNEDGTYSFVQPNGKVTIEAKFAKEVKFADVPENSYYADAVDWAVEKGITNGVDKTHFAPDATCTRAQAVTFLWRALGCPEPTSTKSEFTDVTDADAFYFKAVLWATENGVTLGYDDGRFGVDDVVTRAHMVTFMERAMKGKAKTAESFADVPNGAYYADAAAWAKENGISEGIGDNKFGGETDCLRAQIVTMLYRYFVK